MRAFHTALPALLVCGVLAGCGAPHADGKAAAKGEDAASAATPANVALTPTGSPQRRDGYWEMTSFRESGSPMGKQFLCVGGGSEKTYSVFDQLAIVGNCDKKEFTRTAMGWTFETRCKLMDTVTVQKGTISGDFQQGFRIDQAVTQGDTETKGSIRGKRVGDCPAKYQAGDLVDSDGEKLGNILPQ